MHHPHNTDTKNQDLTITHTQDTKKRRFSRSVTVVLPAPGREPYWYIELYMYRRRDGTSHSIRSVQQGHTYPYCARAKRVWYMYTPRQYHVIHTITVICTSHPRARTPLGLALHYRLSRSTSVLVCGTLHIILNVSMTLTIMRHRARAIAAARLCPGQDAHLPRAFNRRAAHTRHNIRIRLAHP